MKSLLFIERLEQIRESIKKCAFIPTKPIKNCETHVKVSKRAITDINNSACDAICLIDSIMPERGEL